MNKLPIEKQILILSQLVEGASIRSIERTTGVNRNTIMSLLVKAGDRAAYIMDRRMKEIHAEYIQIDEIWTYVQCKQRHLAKEDRGGERGDQWVYVAIDADTKLVPSFLVGKRNYANTEHFISDLASRVPGEFQLSSDSLRMYTEVVPQALGHRVDYGQVHKDYGEEIKREKRYGPAYLVKVTLRAICGDPATKKISTSYVERQNLTMRMGMRRLTRLTNAFSKKLENLIAAVNLHFYYYNFMRVHSAHGLTPAFAAGITQREVWGWEPLLK